MTAPLPRERIEELSDFFRPDGFNGEPHWGDGRTIADTYAALRELLHLREERAALREYVEHLDTDPLTSLFSSTKEHSEAWAKWQKKFKALRAKIGRSEGGQWEER